MTVPPASAAVSARRDVVSVAIPVRNGGALLSEVLEAVTAQRLDAELEIVVCDSASTDGSADRARRHGATVLEIAPSQFGHGRTRNLLMEHSRGGFVAFLTQDAVPADDRWLARLASGLELADDVALAFGPYVPRPRSSPMVARELTAWFASLSESGAPVLDRLAPAQQSLPPRVLMGRRGYFTSANGCVRRSAWERVRFRDVPYAEDHVLAHDMLRAGFAKAFVPDAAVVHSHDYTIGELARRNFDEGRAMAAVYGWRAPLRTIGREVWGSVGADRRFALAGRSLTPAGQLELLVASTVHHLARTAGAALGGRADRLPDGLVRRLSLERRSG